MSRGPRRFSRNVSQPRPSPRSATARTVCSSSFTAATPTTDPMACIAPCFSADTATSRARDDSANTMASICAPRFAGSGCCFLRRSLSRISPAARTSRACCSVIQGSIRPASTCALPSSPRESRNSAWGSTMLWCISQLRSCSLSASRHPYSSFLMAFSTKGSDGERHLSSRKKRRRPGPFTSVLTASRSSLSTAGRTLCQECRLSSRLAQLASEPSSSRSSSLSTCTCSALSICVDASMA
mmetsp:Transcript_564/g.1917  ORF Transcript_564/g.1917 Transcript_564/m.1917 type:complete len:241 (-) Transcript_564:257-979(-)